MSVIDNPAAEYTRRHAARQETLRTLERRESFVGLLRVAAFLSIPAVFYAAVAAGNFSLLWGLVAVGAFIAAVVWHRRVVALMERTQRAIRYYAKALARLDDRWTDAAPRGERYRRPEHPYALDLDLFGRASLFQLLCAARTRMGQNTLAAWLLSAAEPEVIRTRHAAIDELRNGLDLREKIAVLDASIQTELHPEKLLAWAVGPAKLVDWVRPGLAVVLAVASVATLAAWIVGLGLWPFLLVATVQGLLLLQMRRPMQELAKHIDSALGELNLLVQMLRIIERQRFTSPRLQEIVGRLQSHGRLPSERIARLARLVDYWETIRNNQFVVPFAFVLMLFVHVAYGIERWRVRYGRLVGEWLDAVGEFEALDCFAAYAYEHPGQPFPEIDEQGHCFEAEELGHPLIPAGRRVTNDVALSSERQLLLVSGSNMSGKSTLLRSVGINAVLALAGAPICAKRLRISPQAVASVMRTADSLEEGVSAFYAEIKRLRAAFDLTSGRLPILFLFDEILHGTNSQDRRAGAAAVIDGLLQRSAIGIVTTHDLALAEIAEKLKPRAANVHFEDQLIDGQIRFDYRLRPGVVPKGNGLVLMRLLGFDV